MQGGWADWNTPVLIGGTRALLWLCRFAPCVWWPRPQEALSRAAQSPRWCRAPHQRARPTYRLQPREWNVAPLLLLLLLLLLLWRRRKVVGVEVRGGAAAC